MAHNNGWPKFGIRQMLVMTGVIAAGCALLLYADRDKTSGGVLASVVFCLLLFSAVGVVCGSGVRRARCAGFFIGCLSYLLVIGYVVETKNKIGGIAGEMKVRRFLTSTEPTVKCLQFTAELIHEFHLESLQNCLDGYSASLAA